MPIKAYYEAQVSFFLSDDIERILGVLTAQHHHSLDEPQRWAWLQQVSILKAALSEGPQGRILFELYIPRMGKRADAALVTDHLIFILEFKVGATEYSSGALDQVEDYALDLKNFHEGSHKVPIVPVLVSTQAAPQSARSLQFGEDLVALPVGTDANGLGDLIRRVCSASDFPIIDFDLWSAKGYKPTPTIVEAAQVLYSAHTVADISRSDAGAKNLRETSAAVNLIIDQARHSGRKSICFVTGVPGSGKTLAGLNIATRRSREHHDENAAFLSGNGPLVDVLREALARDKVRRESVTKANAERVVRSFIQNIHHFRDEYVSNDNIPDENVVVFDEAQRAWNREQAAAFMQRKRGQADFDMSEPEFLLGVMNRHLDWCTVVCLVGEGQEINTGEAGISEWLVTLDAKFPHWDVHISPRISLPEYGSKIDLKASAEPSRVRLNDDLHLSVPMRSFRAEALSQFIAHILDNEPKSATSAYQSIKAQYPLYLTRDLTNAREWLRGKARGSERFGLVASSGAQRLRPEGIHIKAAIDPPNWFLNSKSDIRSSFYLEDVATEFAVQGLELDWVGVCWDGDFHYGDGAWVHQSFKGTKWQSVHDESRQRYLKNAYRVILTRARQGMIIFVPKGDSADHTRPKCFYDGTFEFLRSCGLTAIE